MLQSGVDGRNQKSRNRGEKPPVYEETTKCGIQYGTQGGLPATLGQATEWSVAPLGGSGHRMVGGPTLEDSCSTLNSFQIQLLHFLPCPRRFAEELQA